ncbi:DUF4166 domain-containing protein [Filibacter tadaridae]|uniref:DUF4166 domain-containing protein n=1 Tax=Filibacter tadaridae TaxID=2483811 RepID=A0A3P5X2R6_9BACL|nr:DUF4166 domain-containing protein [Filibacter tadaridae]VDC22497.1 hypothetical protein FILTAD_00766 [Filibacter tadaridae]
MSIYKNALRQDFYRLHPMLQKRYDLPAGAVFKASGIMKTIKGGPKWLFPLFYMGTYWKLLFPEHGHEIPFTIRNTAFVGDAGEEQVHWERIFHFGRKKRYFNALMSLDLESRIVKDYLGEPALVYSDLALSVTDGGGLTIKSLNQKLILGKLGIPLPRIFQGLATITENYNEARACYKISVAVQNPLIGTVFSYEGEFNAHEDA